MGHQKLIIFIKVGRTVESLGTSDLGVNRMLKCIRHIHKLCLDNSKINLVRCNVKIQYSQQ